MVIWLVNDGYLDLGNYSGNGYNILDLRYIQVIDVIGLND